jgi:hypothetical protein
MSDHNQQLPDEQRIVSLLHEMLKMHVDQVDCTTCGDNLDCLADLVAAGHDPKQAWPAIYAHIKCCRHCGEEYQALVAVLVAEQAGKLDALP